MRIEGSGQQLYGSSYEEDEVSPLQRCMWGIKMLQQSEAEKLAKAGKGELEHSNQLGENFKWKIKNAPMLPDWRLDADQLKEMFVGSVVPGIPTSGCRKVFTNAAREVVNQHKSRTDKCQGIDFLACHITASQDSVGDFNRLLRKAGIHDLSYEVPLESVVKYAKFPDPQPLAKGETVPEIPSWLVANKGGEHHKRAEERVEDAPMHPDGNLSTRDLQDKVEEIVLPQIKEGGLKKVFKKEVKMVIGEYKPRAKACSDKGYPSKGCQMVEGDNTVDGVNSVIKKVGIDNVRFRMPPDCRYEHHQDMQKVKQGK